MSKILLVEDDLPLSAGLCFELDTSGYLTVAAYHCRKALKQDVLKGFDYETGHCSGR
jgi:DNA-binding response OmpR family regulator